MESSKEKIEERRARLRNLSEALESQLDPGWVYVLVVGKPGEKESVNMLSNAPLEMTDKIIKEMASRCANGERPRNL